MPDFGLVFYNLPGHDLERFVTFASESGFTCAEIPVTRIWDHGDLDVAQAQARALHELLAAHGMHLSALSAGNDFIQPDDSALAAQVDRLCEICRLARLAGTSMVRIDGGHPKDTVAEDHWFTRIVQGLRQIRPFIEAEGFTLALDNHGLVTNDADFQARVFDAVGSPNLGANLDTMNYRWRGHDLPTVERFYRVIAPYVRHTHIKDGRGSRATYQGTVLGQGELNLLSALDALVAVSYRGPWLVEYEGQTDHEAGYRAGLDWLHAHVLA